MWNLSIQQMLGSHALPSLSRHASTPSLVSLFPALPPNNSLSTIQLEWASIWYKVQQSKTFTVTYKALEDWHHLLHLYLMMLPSQVFLFVSPEQHNIKSGNNTNTSETVPTSGLRVCYSRTSVCMTGSSTSSRSQLLCHLLRWALPDPSPDLMQPPPPHSLSIRSLVSFLP